MSIRSEGSELRLNRSSSPESTKSSSAVWPEFSSPSSTSSYSSNLTIESSSTVLSPEEAVENVPRVRSQEIKAMPLVGCPRCFMYVMLSHVDPKCPKCNSTVFLDFFRE